jgi:hypothetical protein
MDLADGTLQPTHRFQNTTKTNAIGLNWIAGHEKLPVAPAGFSVVTRLRERVALNVFAVWW